MDKAFKILFDLAVVIPIYNEEECIAQVIDSWINVLSQLDINYLLIVLNDGSKDNTLNALKKFENHKNVEIIDKENSGHGPTIIIGYKKAVQIADWIFQCDSDNEIEAVYFTDLWKEREYFDAIFGIREARKQNLTRRIISQCSRISVNLLFGRGVIDVNVPFRLMKSSTLKKIISKLPEDTFAPNVIISGVLAKSKIRIKNHPVVHQGRKTGRESIVKLKLWKYAFKSFWQTMTCSFSINI